MSVAETTSGRVRGSVHDGVLVFKGIPYAASTAGAARFLPARPAVPWAGIRDAFEYGPTAIQPRVSTLQLLEGGRLGEDCLVLNVWTPACDSAKRPVMVWIHGGGFAIGSGDADGDHLARDQDVVVVSLNHRLNAFGHLYLRQIGGDEYADSGNAGLLDIVSALIWVRDNIEAFGGDPANVTLFGHSGGGWKISALLAMPAAHGLFHKAILQSGSMLRLQTVEEAAEATNRLLALLEIAPDRWERLRDLPAEAIIDALMRKHPSGLPPGRIEDDGTLTWEGDLPGSPVVDGGSLPRQPFLPDAPALAAGIPLIVGTARDEFVGLPTWITHVEGAKETLERVGLARMLEQTDLSPTQAQRLAQAYATASPEATDSELLDGVIGDATFLVPTVRLAEAKALQNDGAVYSYLFSWGWHGADGAARHGYDVVCCFGDPEPLLGSDRDESTRRLARRMSTAWAAFARTGDPNHADLPAWPSYTLPARATMVFDHTCTVESDPRKAQREALIAARSAP